MHLKLQPRTIHECVIQSHKASLTSGLQARTMHEHLHDAALSLLQQKVGCQANHVVDKRKQEFKSQSLVQKRQDWSSQPLTKLQCITPKPRCRLHDHAKGMVAANWGVGPGVCSATA